MQTWQTWLEAQEIDARWHPATRLQDEYRPTSSDRRAAFSLYTELRTRITLQPLHPLSGDEATALKSVFALFGTARMTMQSEGPAAMFFADLATAMLNGPIRPFTARWHGVSEAGQLRPGDSAIEFRRQLRRLQEELRPFAKAFRAMADEHAGAPPFPHEQKGGGTATSTPSSDPALPGLPAGLDSESSHVLTRREAGDAPAPPTLTGLALSGGGVRSATFCLGVIRALARHGLLREFDYLSTVSGGGYMGAFVSTLPPHQGQIETTLQDPVVLSELRRRSIHHLLGANPIVNVLQALVGYVGGLLLNLAPALTLLAALLLLREGVTALPPIWLMGTLAALGLGFLFTPRQWPRMRMACAGLAMAAAAVGAHGELGTWSWIWAGTTVGATCSLAALWRWRRFRHQWRDAAIGLAVLAAIAASHDAAKTLTTALRDADPTLAWIALGGLAVAGASVLLGLRRVARGIGLLIAATVVPLAAVTLFFACKPEVLTDTASHILWVGEYLALHAALPALAVALLGLALMLLGNVNYNAPHRFYRARLAEAYIAPNLVGPAPKLSEMADLVKPLHLIQATVNLPGSGERAQRGRGCGVFTFSPFRCGSDDESIAAEELEQLDPHLDIATAIAISGAAASSLMGVVAPRATVPLLTFLNIRLGYWVQRAREAGESPPKTRGRPNLFYLLREALGWVDEHTNCWNVSDGGHFENLGVYQLLQRRCGFIVVVDAEADFARTCDAIVRLIHLARVDLGHEIRINLGDLSPDENGHSRRHAAFGTIDYHDPTGGDARTRGYLLYFKASLTGDEDPTIRTYHRRHPSFPHESTANQHFGEDQFEAYRVLGEHVAERVLEDALPEGLKVAGARLEQLRTHLRQTMLPDA